MKVLSNDDCRNWLKKTDYKILNEKLPRLSITSLRQIGACEWFEIPRSASFYLTLSHRLCKWFNDSPALLLVTEWPIFSEEEMAIFLERRQSCGYDERLIDAPGHYFETRTIEDNLLLTTLMHYMMVLNWEGLLLHPDKQSVVGLADQVIEIITADPVKLQEARILFHDVGIAPVKLYS